MHNPGLTAARIVAEELGCANSASGALNAVWLLSIMLMCSDDAPSARRDAPPTQPVFTE
ncbi:MAG TPA: hypothetical protein PKB14_13685 [Rubrivivax sp.]|nr:hypothetical protein [Rubrivivax sp.]